MKVFTAQQMRDFDKEAIENYGIPSIVLMENAALRVVEFLEAKFSPLPYKKVVILCGKGNNGGDGLAIARHLEAAGCSVTVYLACKISDLQGNAAVQLAPFSDALAFPTNGLSFKEIKTQDDFVLDEPDLVIDALLGTGFKGPVRNEILEWALDFRDYMTCPVIAVDIASGTNADSGEAGEDMSGVDYTVTFAAPKRGQFVRDGIASSGEIWVGDIGSLEKQMENAEVDVETLGLGLQGEFACFLFRSVDAHKGDAGRALIVGGSFGMSGALALASRAALASGAGLCIAAMPEKILPSFAASILEATSHPLPCDESGKLLERAADELPQLWKGVQVVAVGPGISRSEEAQKFVQRVVRECPVPLVIDADALHALPFIPDAVKNREADTILTPHPGEMGTLMGISSKEVNGSRFEVVVECAKKYGAFVVLKGARSLVATPDGRVFVNLTGNPGMATGGSGDILTGTIAGLLAQTKDAESATKLGVYLHGYAGDLAFAEKGNGLVAGDIAANLARALVALPTLKVEQINGRLRKLM